MKNLVTVLLLLLWTIQATATDYYIHPTLGNDNNDGISRSTAFKTLQRIESLVLKPGDRILLASGCEYAGGLKLIGQRGSTDFPIRIMSINWDNTDMGGPAEINFRGFANGILIEDGNNISIENIALTANGHPDIYEPSAMRCGVLIRCVKESFMHNINISGLCIKDVYYENPGFVRGKEEVRTANGTQRYGWGIRIINDQENHLVENIRISKCRISDVSHTGLKLTGTGRNIREVRIADNKISYTGGPGIQMSGVQFVYVSGNIIDHSGSDNDSRKWGRGSGLWTWSSSNVLIEKNQFLHANGPGDSAGAHIDFNCDNVVIQYNLSMQNAGGFCEILGNTYNCAYRYNISVNDGFRTKGKNGAFQEGKIIWLSGYVGNRKPRKGPVNIYIYNNTVYCDSSIVPKVAIDSRSSGVLIANNIFHVQNRFQWVNGDQSRPDSNSVRFAHRVIFEHNLFLQKDSWSANFPIKDEDPLYGDAGLNRRDEALLSAFIPANRMLVQNKGIEIPYLPGDFIGLLRSVRMNRDILGKTIEGKPGLGAIQP